MNAIAEPILIKGVQADFIQAEYAGENTSGLKVYGKNVLVLVDQCSGVTIGGVHVTDDRQEKMTMGAETGAIFDIGSAAFRRFDDGEPWAGAVPKIGERIYFEKYAGTVAMGRDGKFYRIMDGRCIAAGLDQSGEQE